MRFSTLTTLLTTTSLASAVITGITAPWTLAPNTTFSLTLISENYIQTVADVAVAWGFDLAPAHPGALGPYFDSAYVSLSLLPFSLLSPLLPFPSPLLRKTHTVPKTPPKS
jgi:hypothetical protein